MYDAPKVSEESATPRRPADLLSVRVFLVALSALLAGYMFMGRGFAHLGWHPVYVGEVVLLLGLICTGIVVFKLKPRFSPSRIVWLLLAFMLLGAVQTVPYLGDYGFDALRDGVLWGYGLFALMLFVVADRALLLGAMRLYGWVVPVFAVWLPIGWSIFLVESQGIDPNRPGGFIPIVFFKAGDMAVHVVGSIAFLVLAAATIASARIFVWRALVALPLTWMTFITATVSRGALLVSIAGYGAVALLAGRVRNWMPVMVAAVVLIAGLSTPGLLGPPSPPVAVETPSLSAAPSSPGPTSPSTGPQATPAGRTQDIGQVAENFTSVFAGNDGTRAFRLAWWRAIVDYTVFGPYFWTGKGFGINLADADGFQPTGDRSLRAPHNSHISTLARMGVPGFVLWILLQGSFGIGLLRSVLAHRRAGELRVAVVGSWILAYWTAMMVVTSFDPYLESPQGGIWFWTLFGLGLVVMHVTSQRSAG